MTEPTPDLWHSRDLPVLRELVRLAEADHFRPGAADAASVVGIDEHEAWMSIKRLERGGYVELPPPRSTRTGDTDIQTVTADAYRAVGAWPTTDTALERMLAALEAIVANTDDEDTRTRARKVLDGFSGAGRSIGISVASAAITGQIPGV